MEVMETSYEEKMMDAWKKVNCNSSKEPQWQETKASHCSSGSPPPPYSEKPNSTT
jgi:hypothetical protein